MDDLLGTLFYIIISVALIVISALRKNKKQSPKSAASAGQAAENPSKNVTDNSFWEELLGIEEEKPAYQMESTDYPNYDTAEQKEEPKHDKKQERENKVSLTQDETTTPTKEKKQAVKPTQQKPAIGAELRRRKELRKAIIYSEIIKPKHF